VVPCQRFSTGNTLDWRIIIPIQKSIVIPFDVDNQKRCEPSFHLVY
jgi:hypothetical protein